MLEVSTNRKNSLGEVPPHLQRLKQELEKTFANLEQKNEILVSSMQKNFGKTHQDLPNFRLPNIVVQKRAMMEKQSDVLGPQEMYAYTPHPGLLEIPNDKSGGILKKTLSSVTKSY